MQDSARCDLKSKRNILRLHDKFPNVKCNCKKQITFKPRQSQLEGSGFQNKLQKIFRASQEFWNKFLKPAVSLSVPFIGMAVAGKPKNPQAGQSTTIILKPNNGGKILSFRDVQGDRLRFRVM